MPENANSNRRWVRVLLNAFIIFHLLIMVVWGLPGSKFRNKIAVWIEDYVVWIGLWHSWDMFAPEPLSLNFNLEAEVIFADGSKTIWEFPRMEKLNLTQKFVHERWRKWRERIRQDAYRAVWADTARWVARAHNNPTNPPVRVAFTRYWSPIPPPTQDGYQPIPREPVQFKHNYRFFNYQVKKEDL